MYSHFCNPFGHVSQEELPKAKKAERRENNSSHSPTMRAPSIPSLSLRRIQPRQPSTVAPLPIRTPFDHQLTAELKALIEAHGTNEPFNFITANGLAQLLDASIAAQKIALCSFVNITYREDMDRQALDGFLESNIELLDACNYFVEKIEIIKKYLNSLRVVLRLVDGKASPNQIATKRALGHLESFQAMKKECRLMGKRGSFLRRMLKQKSLCHQTDFGEIACGSEAMALMVCRFLESSLSFDSKRRLPWKTRQSQPTSSSWLSLLQEVEKQVEESEKLHKRKSESSLMMMTELKSTVIAAENLQDQIQLKSELKELKSAAEGLKRNCNELEDGLQIIEGRVQDLYKVMIDVRMILLGILSQA